MKRSDTERWHAVWSQRAAMWTRRLACALVGSVLVACGRGSDVAASPAATPDDSGSSDAGAAQHAGGTLDATATGAADAAVDAGATGNAQCQWPPYLNPPAGGGASVPVGRYLLSCRVAPADAGLATTCISNDPNACPVHLTASGTGSAVLALVDCVDQCKADEYAVSVEDPPRMTMDNPFVVLAPLGCRGLGHTMYGSTYFCCPCVTADAGADLDAAAVDSRQPGAPTCSADESCKYVPHGQQCLPRCDEQGGCPTGDECKTMVGCCAGTGCAASLVRVCCPPTGC